MTRTEHTGKNEQKELKISSWKINFGRTESNLTNELRTCPFANTRTTGEKMEMEFFVHRFVFLHPLCFDEEEQLCEFFPPPVNRLKLSLDESDFIQVHSLKMHKFGARIVVYLPPLKI